MVRVLFRARHLKGFVRVFNQHILRFAVPGEPEIRRGFPPVNKKKAIGVEVRTTFNCDYKRDSLAWEYD